MSDVTAMQVEGDAVEQRRVALLDVIQRCECAASPPCDLRDALADEARNRSVMLPTQVWAGCPVSTLSCSRAAR